MTLWDAPSSPHGANPYTLATSKGGQASPQQ